MVTASGQVMVEFAPEVDRFASARKKGPNRWILAHLLHGWNSVMILIIAAGVIVATASQSLMIVFIGEAIDEFGAGVTGRLLHWGGLILVLAVGGPLVNMVVNFFREVLAQRMERDARHEFYINLLGKSQSFHDQQRIGDLMARATNDVRMLNFFVSPAVSLMFESSMSVVVPLVLIGLLYPADLLLVPFIFVVLFAITLRGYTNKLGPVTGKLRMEFGQMNSVLNETLAGIEVTKASVTEEYEMDRYYKNAKGYRDAFVEQGKIQAKYVPLLLFALAVTAGLGHSLLLNFDGRMTVGAVIAYVGLLNGLRFPTFISIWVFALVKLATAGAERLVGVMEKTSDIDENIQGIEREVSGAIRFEDVSFKYPGSEKYVLTDLNFSVEPGQVVAIVGTTGSGKSTLTKLISRLYDVEEGSVQVDNIDVKCYQLQSLRSQISFIEQDTFLFSDTIAENISFGASSMNIEQIQSVSRMAQADDFISKLPQGYQSEVGERGVQLSGGQRQRIAIARAFLADPKILVLDDSTSAIDSETEDRIQKAIRSVLKGRTTFLITHRLSQIRWADLILVMKRGRIIAKGTHEDLLKTSEEYRKIFVKRFDMRPDELLQKAQEEV